MACTISAPPNPNTISSYVQSARPEKLQTSPTTSTFLPPRPAAPAAKQFSRLSTKPNGSRRSQLAAVWREIQGSDDWRDLVGPAPALDPLLRDEVVRYGEFVMACYKAFDLHPRSKRYLHCKYPKHRMLEEVGMTNYSYEITKYIYATPNITIPTQAGSSRSRWIGYVAVSSDAEVRRLGRRDLLVTFRGTVTGTEWIANFMSSLTPANLDPSDHCPEVKVESGFLSLYTSDDSTCRFSHGSCREQLLHEISRLVGKYKDEEMSITLAGHSMGSALAVLSGYDVAELGLNRLGFRIEIPITVYSFGGPRVGNLGFRDRCGELGVKVLRVANSKDPVTKLPGVFLNEAVDAMGGELPIWIGCSCYAHVGVEIAMDFFSIRNPGRVHDLEGYIGSLKCPAMAGGGFEVLRKKAKKLVKKKQSRLSCSWPWQDAARQMGNLALYLGLI